MTITYNNNDVIYTIKNGDGIVDVSVSENGNTYIYFSDRALKQVMPEYHTSQNADKMMSKYFSDYGEIVMKYGTGYYDYIFVPNLDFNKCPNVYVKGKSGSYENITKIFKNLFFNLGTVTYGGRKYVYNSYGGSIFNDKVTTSQKSMNVTIYGGYGNDTLSGGIKNDYINGGTGNDYLYGGAGNDKLYGDTGSDYLYGDAGNDYLYGENGNDYLSGGVGNDTIKGGEGNDKIYGDAGNDYLYGENSNDYLSGGVGNDTIKGGEGNDKIYGDAGNDYLYGENGNDYLSGGVGNDTLKGGEGKDSLYGDAGNDYLYGENGNDVLDGGLGNDTINGGNGNDKLTGGKGNDAIYTGSGSDTVYFNAGDGKDILYTGSGSDTLVFSNIANLSKLKSELKLSKSGNNLVINYTKKDSVTLYNYYKSGTDTSVATIKAKNGDSVSFADFYGSYVFNTYTVAKNRAGNITGSDLNDLIKGNSKNDTLKGGKGNDQIYGEDGNDYIDGGAGNDIIYSGKGNDTINAGLGNNALYFSTGDGTDTVKNGKGVDTLVFSNEKNIDNIKISQKQSNLILQYGKKDSVIIENYSENHSTQKIKIGKTTYNIQDLLEVPEEPVPVPQPEPEPEPQPQQDDSIINGTDGDDTINTSTVINHTVNAKKGNDLISIQNGNNTYVFNTGDGIDTIISGLGNDTISFGTAQTLSYSHDLYNNDLVISYGDYDKITLKDYFVNNSHSVATIINGNQQDTINNLIENNLNEYYTKYNSSIEGRQLNIHKLDKPYTDDQYANFVITYNHIQGLNIEETETAVYALEDCQILKNDVPVLNQNYGSDNDDTIIAGSDNSPMYGLNGNDYLRGSNLNDSIYGGAGNDVIYGEDGNDTINAGIGSDTVNAGAGNDIIIEEDSVHDLNEKNNLLYGGSGNDTYNISLWQYTNNLFDIVFDESGDNDSIVINNFDKNSLVLKFDVKVDNDGNILNSSSKDMFITRLSNFTSNNKDIKVIEQFAEGHNIETIEVSDGNYDYIITADKINQLRQDIASWLHTNGFTSVQQIIDSNNQTNINNLIAQFQNADWQAINV